MISLASILSLSLKVLKTFTILRHQESGHHNKQQECLTLNTFLLERNESAKGNNNQKISEIVVSLCRIISHIGLYHEISYLYCVVQVNKAFGKVFYAEVDLTINRIFSGVRHLGLHEYSSHILYIIVLLDMWVILCRFSNGFIKLHCLVHTYKYKKR